MAPKRPSAVENPPSPSPSSSEELTDSNQQHNPVHPINPDSGEETDNEVESSEEEEEIEEKNTLTVQKSAPAQSESGESESDEDESSSDTEPTVPAPSVTKKPSVSKPPVSKPKPDAIKAPKMVNNPSAPKSAPPQPNSDDDVSNSDTNSTNAASATTGKSPISKPTLPKQAISETKQEAKKSPIKGDEKRPPIVRIFSEDDVLGILRWMIQCRENGVDPCGDMAAFHEFMKGSLQVSLTKSQLSEKIRRLKKKYITNVGKGERFAKSKPHELELFELSKEVWGDDAVEKKAKNGKRKITNGVEGGGNKRAKRNLDVLESKKEVVPEEGLGEFIKVDEQGFWDSYPRFKDSIEKESRGLVCEEVKKEMMIELSGIGAAKAKEIEGKLKAYQAKEIELKLLRLELIKEQTEMILDVLKKP